MKRLYLRYNEFLCNCALGEGKTYETRRILGNYQIQKIIEKLKQLDSKRNTELYPKEIPAEIKGNIGEMFKGTRIIVKDISEFI